MYNNKYYNINKNDNLDVQKKSKWGLKKRLKFIHFDNFTRIRAIINDSFVYYFSGILITTIKKTYYHCEFFKEFTDNSE